MPEGSGGACIERKRLEICLGLLESGLTSDTLALSFGEKWTNRKLGKRHGCDERFYGEGLCVRELL